MKNTLRFILFFLVFAFWKSLFAQPAIQWDKTIGSPLSEPLRSMQQTADGGYILAGTSSSNIGGEKSENTRGGTDYWLVKLSSDGTKEWDRTIGGPGADDLGSIQQTFDGGFILGGTSNSASGSEKSESGQGGLDYWVVKLDQNGVKIWDKTLGGAKDDRLIGVVQTIDGDYILGGSSFSGIGGSKTEPALGTYVDFWVVKLSSTGNQEWDRTLGTPGPDRMRCLTVTSDGGYIFAGDQGYEEQESGYYLIKITPDGTRQWERTVKGTEVGYAEIQDVQQTPDGGLILGGRSRQPAGGEQSEPSVDDYWIVKLNADLSVSWDNVIGTPFGDDDIKSPNNFAKLVQTDDGGYLLIGSSTEPAGGDKTEDSYNGNSDFWVVKLDESGTLVWEKTIGGANNEIACSIVNTSDGGFVLGGWSNSNTGFDKTENSKGGDDYWVVKLAPEKPELPVTLTTFTTQNENTTALLIWRTTSETRSDHFEVQHSTNGKSWDLLGTINARGESAELETYRYVHNNPALGENLYRLKMIDTDGIFAYSKINSLTFDQELSINMFPNPVSEILTIKMADWKDVVKVQFMNSQSAIVYESADKPKTELDVKKLSSGIYSLKITKSDGSYLSHKVIVAR